MSTRPRITFDEDGKCNACSWATKKTEIDWSRREEQLTRTLDLHRPANGPFDCIVGVSGGKDGSYICHSLKHRFGKRPLAVSVNPPLPFPLGTRNLDSFAASGYDVLRLDIDPEPMRVLNRAGFEQAGFPYYGWMTAIHTALPRIAIGMGIPLIFYGEAGEIEYGGTTETRDQWTYGLDFVRQVYLEDTHERVISRSGLTTSDLHWFTFPDEGQSSVGEVAITEWSRFENWDPYRNYLVAKEHCGLAENEDSNAGTFTNFAQNDQALYALHTYLMYLKFGFGRANQDAAIEIRRGAMDRAQAVNLVNLYDGHYPEGFIDQYLEYYRMTIDEFEAVLDRYANRDLFDKVDGRWRPNFQVV